MYDNYNAKLIAFVQAFNELQQAAHDTEDENGWLDDAKAMIVTIGETLVELVEDEAIIQEAVEDETVIQDDETEFQEEDETEFQEEDETETDEDETPLSIAYDRYLSATDRLEVINDEEDALDELIQQLMTELTARKQRIAQVKTAAEQQYDIAQAEYSRLEMEFMASLV